MTSQESSYYPPRSRGWGRLRSLYCFLVLKPGWIASRSLFGGIGLLLAALLLPGVSLIWIGQKKLAAPALAIYLLGGLGMIASLGHPEATLGCIVMLGTHALCIGLVLHHLLIKEKGDQRAWAGFLVFIPFLLLYGQFQGLVEKVVFPANYRNKIYVASALSSVGQVRRGDYIVYQVDEMRTGAYLIREGYGVGRVWAAAGDRVEFTDESIIVNGVKSARVSRMPRSGSFTVGRNICFVWPDMDVISRAGLDQARMEHMLLTAGLITESRFVGKIYKYWFWRKQL